MAKGNKPPKNDKANMKPKKPAKVEVVNQLGHISK